MNNAVTTIYLVRHGETAWNATGRCQGTEDVPMNDVGRAQVAALARELADVRFDAAYTSPLNRTRETARAILADRDMDATPVLDLIELSYGDLQGTAAASWHEDLQHAWKHTPWMVTFPNGESLDMVKRRAVPALDRIVANHPGQVVLISSHGHLNRVLALHVNEQAVEEFWAIEQPNASVLIFHFPVPATNDGDSTND